MAENIEKMEQAVATILEEMGEDINREGLLDTPKRVAKMFLEISQSLREEPPRVALFTNDEQYDQMVVLSGIKYYSTCFTGDTRISIAKTKNRNTKAIRLIKTGDKVLTLNKAGNIVEKEVLNTFRHKRDSLKQIILADKTLIKCTDEHPIYVDLRGWVKAEDLLIGDYVYKLRNNKGRYNINRQAIKEININSDLGYVLGVLLSDGSISRNAVRLEVSERWFAEKFITALKRCFGIDAHIDEILKPSGFKGIIKQYRVRVVNGSLVSILKELTEGNHTTKNFKVPRVCLNSYEVFQGFCEAYIDGDGSEFTHKDKNIKYNRISSTNKEFILEMANIFKGNYQTFNGLYGEIYTTDIPLFINNRQNREYEKIAFIEKFNSTIKNLVPVTINVEYEKIKIISIEDIKLAKPINFYNIEVAEENTYIANGVWVHNCEHHLVPFVGEVHVGYLPDKTYIGLSKIPRIVDYFAKKPQIQEKLTEEIAHYLFEKMKPKGLIVLVTGEHMCVSSRGAKKPGVLTSTCAIKGNIDKTEFFTLIGK